MSEHQRIAEYLLGKSLPTRSEYRAPCPAHNGRDHNLSIAESRSGGTLFKCHSHGCSFEEIKDSLPEHLFDDRAPNPFTPREKPAPEPVTLARKPDSGTFDFGLSMWKQSEWVRTTDHAYAVKKHMADLGPRVRVGVLPRDYAMLKKDDRVLVIQMNDEDGCIVGFQFIAENGDRAFAGNQGMLKLSNEIPTEKSVFHIVEGYATGTAVNVNFPESHNIPIVAFSLGNLDKVEHLVRERVKDMHGFEPNILVHREPEGIDLWDLAFDPVKRARYFELMGEAA